MVEREDWALVLGGADCVWHDLIQLERIIGKAWPGYVVAVNDLGVWWVRELHAWCSLHTDKLMANAREKGQERGSWIAQRDGEGLPDGYLTYGKDRKKHGVDRTVPMPHAGGSSGMLAVEVARDLLGGAGRGRIVLCGTPMDVRPHFVESHTHHSSRDWTAANSHYKAWKTSAENLRKDVRSMSGRTRRLLGYPTEDWLHG